MSKTPFRTSETSVRTSETSFRTSETPFGTSETPFRTSQIPKCVSDVRTYGRKRFFNQRLGLFCFVLCYKSFVLCLPVQAATGGRSGVSVYKAGRSVPLDSAQLDLSRLALPQLGSAGVEKCFETHVPFSGLKTPKHRKRPKMHFTNRIRALAANLLQNVVRQERTRIRVPSPSFPNAQKFEQRNFFYTTAPCIIGSARGRPKSTYPPQV